ncbi:sensor histidine kinase [Bowmanella yangjiangensis]|uniref:Histidine kinase n=1 Tax=Bowmanella yangjiangensis TaxID=2811230 RepID=A0ABS3CQK8_9ALTE|nr:histidine kinase [Bowmanella yangjiangensis]MBN7819377.1 histidine kinase [Bowmanella yangjiangensis]
MTEESFSSAVSKPSFWLLHTAGWLFYYLLMLADNMLLLGNYNALGCSILYILIPVTLIGFVLTLPVRYLYRHCWNLPFVYQAAVIIAVSALLASLWIVPKNLLFYWASGDDIFNLSANPKFKWQHLFMMVSNSFFIMMVWSSLYFGINYHYRLVQAQEQQLRSARLSHLAQIRMLRYQINPHFLFNTLNALSTLVMKGDKPRSGKMIEQLATFLRFSLDSEPEKKIRLHDEIKALMMYLEIEKVRFSDRLDVEVSVTPEARMAMVPSMLLQPLVENCIKHAIAKMSDGGVIKVQAWLENKMLHLQVADNGPLTDVNQVNLSGVGLQNIIERLEVLYGQYQKLRMDVQGSHGLRVTLVIPFEEEPWTELPLS